jgi:hypothetical protein
MKNTVISEDIQVNKSISSTLRFVLVSAQPHIDLDIIDRGPLSCS